MIPGLLVSDHAVRSICSSFNGHHFHIADIRKYRDALAFPDSKTSLSKYRFPFERVGRDLKSHARLSSVIVFRGSAHPYRGPRICLATVATLSEYSTPPE
jgi:hypothetical protein